MTTWSDFANSPASHSGACAGRRRRSPPGASPPRPRACVRHLHAGTVQERRVEVDHPFGLREPARIRAVGAHLRLRDVEAEALHDPGEEARTAAAGADDEDQRAALRGGPAAPGRRCLLLLFRRRAHGRQLTRRTGAVRSEALPTLVCVPGIARWAVDRARRAGGAAAPAETSAEFRFSPARGAANRGLARASRSLPAHSQGRMDDRALAPGRAGRDPGRRRSSTRRSPASRPRSRSTT